MLIPFHYAKKLNVCFWFVPKSCSVFVMISIKMRAADTGIVQKGMLTTFPQWNFALEFPEILSQNIISYHWRSVSGNSVMMHNGILINMPFLILQLFHVNTMLVEIPHTDWHIWQQKNRSSLQVIIPWVCRFSSASDWYLISPRSSHCLKSRDLYTAL